MAKAARAGLFPVPPTLVFGAAMLATAGVLAIASRWVSTGMVEMTSQALTRAVSRGEPWPALQAVLRGGVVFVLPLLGAVLVAVLIAAGVPALVVRRGKPRTSVSLPRVGSRSAAILVFRGTGVLVFALVAVKTMRDHAILIPDLIDGRLTALAHLREILVNLFAGAGVIGGIVGLMELVYQRHRVWRALHLNRSEANREARAAGGDRSVRAEQRRRSRIGGRS